MGSKEREIIGMDVYELIGLLRRAFSDELLAYHQYRSSRFWKTWT